MLTKEMATFSNRHKPMAVMEPFAKRLLALAGMDVLNSHGTQS